MGAVGQHSAVDIHYLVARETADEAMWGVLQSKVRQLSRALDGNTRGRMEVESHDDWQHSQEVAEAEDGVDGDGGSSGGGEEGSSAALSLLGRKAERERLLKRERSRAAFNSLFGPRPPTAPTARAPTPASPAVERPAVSPSGSATGGAANGAFEDEEEVIDLTQDDALEDGCGPTAADEQQPSSSQPPPDAWFAVSSLTGRIHAFGSGETAQPEGLCASALPHDILDDDPSSLPAALREPSMLEAARRWVTDYEALTPAQRAALHDRPARVPLIRTAARPFPFGSTTAPSGQPSSSSTPGRAASSTPPAAASSPRSAVTSVPTPAGAAPLTSAASSATASSATAPSCHAARASSAVASSAAYGSAAGSREQGARSSAVACSAAASTPPPIQDRAFVAAGFQTREGRSGGGGSGGGGSGGGGGGSGGSGNGGSGGGGSSAPSGSSCSHGQALAEHGSPAAELPAASTLRETTSESWAARHAPSTPHQTLTWCTSASAVSRTWTQHFSVEHALPHCLYCLTLHTPAQDSPFCSDKCAAAFQSAETRASARRQLFDRELGVCQACGFDAHSFYRRVVALPTEQARLQAWIASTLTLTLTLTLALALTLALTLTEAP